MELQKAQEILSSFYFSKSSEIIDINSALNRYLAEDIIAKKDLPCFDNSALDGYAFNFEDVNKNLKIVGESFAGDTDLKKIKNGECIKIMTGAKIPIGADTILRFEDSKLDDNGYVKALNIPRKGDAYRYRGEETKVGNLLIKKGTKLNASMLMMCAAQGISKVQVLCEPKIGIFSTGNEIVEPWQKANEDQIYNANATAISAILASYGFKSEYLGIIPDDKEKTILSIKKADEYDILITSGGASKGEADFISDALKLLKYDEIFSYINIRPGRPAKAYKKNDKLIFILPGNPLAAFITTLALVVPTLNKKSLQMQKAILQDNLKIKPNITNTILGTLKDDKFYVYQNGKYSSGMISPLLHSNAVFFAKSDIELMAGLEILVYRFS